VRCAATPRRKTNLSSVAVLRAGPTAPSGSATHPAHISFVRGVAYADPPNCILGFKVVSRSDTPHGSAVLARDDVQIRLAENGGDSSQDGCAFHVKRLESLFAEFNANGLNKELSNFDTEEHGGATWKVFYVVAPDGLCYWFGERQAR
jgi:lactoylglutathione lyase